MLEGKRVSLRGFELFDTSEMLLYWNKKAFLDFSGRTNPLTREELEIWIQETWKTRICTSSDRARPKTPLHTRRTSRGRKIS